MEPGPQSLTQYLCKKEAGVKTQAEVRSRQGGPRLGRRKTQVVGLIIPGIRPHGRDLQGPGEAITPLYPSALHVEAHAPPDPEFRIDGTPPGDGVTLYLALAFPPQGIRNPNTGNMLHAAKIAFPNMKIGALSVLGYGFDTAWEIVPGVWTVQIWYQDRMLAERTFTVGTAE